MKYLPGILNDVIGPVMRGPSSSHTAASWRIAKTAIDMLNDRLQEALIEFDEKGAWVTNYREQGTTIGIEGGLLDLDITDERMKITQQVADEKGIKIEYKVSSFPTNHANTVRLTLHGTGKKQVQLVAISKGGGAFEIQSVNGFDLKIQGDIYALIIFSNGNFDELMELKNDLPSGVNFEAQSKDDTVMCLCTSSYPISADLITQFKAHPDIDEIAVINPVMPIISGRQTEMPFSDIKSLINYASETGADLGDLGLLYEKCISGLSEQELNEKMGDIVDIVNGSIDIGLKGTTYENRILHHQSYLIEKAEKDGKIRESIINHIVANVTALMESKSGMEVVVAIPTAGSCGTVGGLLRAISENMGSGRDDLIKAYFAAGLVGAYFAQGPGFSAEEHGCQVETGAAGGMGAAAMVQLLGGTAKQAIDAASMAIQNTIGLVCDPVADRVEVPCLGKNITAAVNGYASAIMAISGFDAVIPLNQVIQTVSRVSKTMPTCVKCTGKGGLAITDTSNLIKKRLKS